MWRQKQPVQKVYLHFYKWGVLHFVETYFQCPKSKMQFFPQDFFQSACIIRYFIDFAVYNFQFEQQNSILKIQQENLHFQKKEALSDIFAQVKDVDKQIFGVILEIFPKEKLQDCIGQLMDDGNQKDLEQSILQQRKNLNQAQNEKMKQKNHNFNKKDYSTEGDQKSIQILIKRIRDNEKIIEFLQFQIMPKK
ncbi:unnamed protein product [Paramecium primaurelia]|uniref:Uncharacterized protein n=1 Tax=Paramecium primaurelia TaxID=5886 RepID=A0A8S1QL86_PARPR|nr:unnamed protein product [Paramecium primaurelia]